MEKTNYRNQAARILGAALLRPDEQVKEPVEVERRFRGVKQNKMFYTFVSTEHGSLTSLVVRSNKGGKVLVRVLVDGILKQGISLNTDAYTVPSAITLTPETEVQFLYMSTVPASISIKFKVHNA